MSERLRQEFNRWALDGRAADLESHHRCFVEDMIPFLNVQKRDRILEIGCGEGWASRWLAPLAPEGTLVGLDVSDEMIRNARGKSPSFENLLYIWANAEEIPWQENFFTKAFAVETMYYVEHPEQALREILRVLAPGGSLWILNHLSRENELSLRGQKQLRAPVGLLSAEEYGRLLERCGFEGFSYRMLPDRTPVANAPYYGLYASTEELGRMRELGALLITARKPVVSGSSA